MYILQNTTCDTFSTCVARTRVQHTHVWRPMLKTGDFHIFFFCFAPSEDLLADLSRALLLPRLAVVRRRDKSSTCRSKSPIRPSMTPSNRSMVSASVPCECWEAVRDEDEAVARATRADGPLEAARA